MLAIILAAAAPTLAGTPELESEQACLQIQAAVATLGHAEAAQAENLHMLAHGGDLPVVENGLQQIIERREKLREILRRLRLQPIAHEPSVANCLTLGYRALFEAERLSGEIERVLLEIRGYPLALKSPADAPSSEHRGVRN